MADLNKIRGMQCKISGGWKGLERLVANWETIGSKWLLALSGALVTVTGGACRPRDDFQEAMQNERIRLMPWTS